MHSPMSSLRLRYKLKPLSAPLLEVSTGYPCKELEIVPGQVYTLGRSPSRCNVVFQDRRVSRKHCQLYLDPSTAKLFLLNGVTCPNLLLMSQSNSWDSIASSSTQPALDLPTQFALNGVFVNGEALERGRHQILQHGSVVSLVAGARGDQILDDAEFGPAIGFSIVEEDAEGSSRSNFPSSAMQATCNPEVDDEGAVLPMHRTRMLHKLPTSSTVTADQAGGASKHSCFATEEVEHFSQSKHSAGKRRKKLGNRLHTEVDFSESTCIGGNHASADNFLHAVQEDSCLDFQPDCENFRVSEKRLSHALWGGKVVLAEEVNNHSIEDCSRPHVSCRNERTIEIICTESRSCIITSRSAGKENVGRAGTDLLKPASKEETSVSCDRVASTHCWSPPERTRLCGAGGDDQGTTLEGRRHSEQFQTPEVAKFRGTSLSTHGTQVSCCTTQESPKDQIIKVLDVGKGSICKEGQNETGQEFVHQEVGASRSIFRSRPSCSPPQPGCEHLSPPGVYLNKLEGVSATEECNSASLSELLEPLNDVLAIFAATFTEDIEWFLSSNSIPPELPLTIACHNTERNWSPSEYDRCAAPHSKWPNLTVVYPPCPNMFAFEKDKMGHVQGIGCHHPKLFLLQRKCSMRVIITSANLTSSQWSRVTNNVWKQDFPRLRKRSYETLFHNHPAEPNHRGTHGDFAPQLAAFLSSLLVDVPSQVHWVMSLADYDFSDAEATLVASVPGLHGHPYEPITMECGDSEQTVQAEQALGVVDAMVVGIANRFCPASDPKGVRLRELAAAVHKQKEVERGLIRVYLKRMRNLAADSNAVGVFIAEKTDAGSSLLLLQKDQTPKHPSRPSLSTHGTHVQLGFLPRDVAKWVAHLCDSGACIFAGYVSPKDVIAVACGLMGDHPQLTLHVYRSNFFSSFLEGCETSESEVAISCLLRSLKRPVGLWRLHQVLSTYEWPCAGETEFIYASSSIGTSVDAKFLAAFAAAAGQRSTQVTDAVSVDSDPQWGSWTVEQEKEYPSISIVFPTLKRAKCARGGVVSHRGLHYFHEKTWTRLKPTGSLCDAVPFPSSREGFPMHVKVARRLFRNEFGSSYGWVYYGSHNFSPAAWGRPLRKRVKNCRSSAFADIPVLGCTLFVSNYELGIIFVVPASESRSEGDSTRSKENSSKSLDRLQIPFVTPAKRYGSADKPITGQAIREALVECRSQLEVQHLSSGVDTADLEAQPWDDVELDVEVDEVDDWSGEGPRHAGSAVDISTMWRREVLRRRNDIGC